ncbi:MAG: hypothetical protein Q7R62_03325 [bacterium]|nr:hypothetical protein [bacterium]
METEKKDVDFEAMNKHLARIDKALNSSWRSFLRGTFQGLGSILGAVLVIFIIGTILNVVGVIPEFKKYVDDFKNILQEIRTR